MKRLSKYLFINFFVICKICTATVKANTIISNEKRGGDYSSFAMNSIQDVPYVFDQQKVINSKDSFHFLRSFVDYFYDVLSSNKENLNFGKTLSSYSGWCVGDAHAENFGVILKEGASNVFTMNDMDDSGPCPVAYDLLRLLVSSRLYLPTLDINNLLNAYKQGLMGQLIPMPNTIQAMKSKSITKGMNIDPKELDGNKLKRKSGVNEVDSLTRTTISDSISLLFKSENIIILDVVETAKVGGGSGGLIRYEILASVKDQLFHLELKELTNPAILSVATMNMPSQNDRMKESLIIDQGQGFSHYYEVVNLFDKVFLLRPKFSGNVGVSLSENSVQDNSEIIKYEAYILGIIHSKTVSLDSYLNDFNAITLGQVESDVDALTNLFDIKYNSLKK